ncbi:MAG: DNA helicase [Rhodocyclaceae bacterium]|uniref:DNA 3'-5' helicase n=1 Tax=Candidatus Desulfobacillus denitrificans TaxID=2608985 RepID=A0A809QW92_9PROT|nr:DNA helicase II [Candidatus Desulfobacillus denitrificans]GIK46540.1 MAG: DNA helicase [Betaproteobacteria bacterium]GJQ56760.1 MAG: DNA helicase [Rhodocyclaceae bacterium]
MSSYLGGLNPPQLAAVTLPPQHALILAGAGSGKTRVLTTRIAWLIHTGQASPHGILAVTFTNKAAKEMLTRLTAMLPINTRGMWIGTFHGLCNRLLRAHHRDAGLPQLFQILDAADQLAAIKRLLKALDVDDEKFPPRELANFINGQKEAGLRPDAVEAWDDYTRRRVELYREYEAQCQREGVVDFAELLLRSYELLQRNEPIRLHYQGRFRHILVDEFQDTNVLQYRWLKLLAGHPSPPAPLPQAGEGSVESRSRGSSGTGASLFCVGDDDQSIYAFRGAEVGNMRDFEREFKVANVIRLEQNYRSQGNILDAANAIIRHNEARLGKNLWTDAGSGEPIRAYEAFNDAEEARFIVEEVKALAAEGLARREMALLYRSNAQSRVLEHALFSAGLPYRVYGGLRFFERQEVKHALAYLRLIANPDDDGAFLRVVNFPARGIGARSIEQLQDAAKASKVSLYGTAKQGGKAAAFAALVDKLKAACDGLTLPETVEQVLELSGLRAHYRTEKEGQDRLANLDELVNAAESFVAEEGHVDAEGELSGELAAFLAHASLEAGEHQAGEGDNALQLMTVHSAKGLEFDVVFISGLEEGLFPHENSVREDKGLEEERRLMYVAVTRARKRLYVSHAQTRMLHGQTRYNLPSRFFDEIPAELLKWLTPKLARGHGAVSSGLTFAPRRPAWAEPAPAAVQRRMAEKETGGFRIGQSVSHAKFGQGVIVNAEGAGSDARVQVNFGREGVKWLALSVAKLTAA